LAGKPVLPTTHAKREKLERRIAELERQLLGYAEKIAERKSGS
jgi:BMFP domain-containing protein YqiC